MSYRRRREEKSGCPILATFLFLSQRWDSTKADRPINPVPGAPVRGPHGQVFVRGVEVPLSGPGIPAPHKAPHPCCDLESESGLFAARVSQAVQQSADVRRMIPHPEALLNQIGHAGTGPVAGIQARFLRQNPVQFPHGIGIQPSRPAGRGLGAQSLAAFSPECRSPTPQTAPIHSHLPCYLRRGKSLRKQN